jgi:hypothetical protein
LALPADSGRAAPSPRKLRSGPPVVVATTCSEAIASAHRRGRFGSAKTWWTDRWRRKQSLRTGATTNSVQ